MHYLFAMHDYTCASAPFKCQGTYPRVKNNILSSSTLSKEFSSFLFKHLSRTHHVNYDVFKLFFNLPFHKKHIHGCPYIQFDVTVLHVHVFIMFLKEIHVGNYGSWICYICLYGGRKVSAYFVGLTICFPIKHKKNPDTDGSNSSLC